MPKGIRGTMLLQSGLGEQKPRPRLQPGGHRTLPGCQGWKHTPSSRCCLGSFPDLKRTHSIGGVSLALPCRLHSYSFLFYPLCSSKASGCYFLMKYQLPFTESSRCSQRCPNGFIKLHLTHRNSLHHPDPGPTGLLSLSSPTFQDPKRPPQGPFA